MNRRLLVLLAFFASASNAQVVINEVLYRNDPTNSDKLKTHQWVELYNKSAVAVDLSGWKISGRAGFNGPTSRALPSVSLAGGGYLVLHFSQGTNSGTDYYTQDTVVIWNSESDDATLYSPSQIVDFLAWSTKTQPYIAGTSHAAAITAGIWAPGTSLTSDGVRDLPFERPRRVEPGMSVGRDPDSTDSNATADFEPHGGVGARDNSPNRKNQDAFIIASGGSQAALASGSLKPRAAPRRKWTVMLYFNGDNSLEKYIFGNMKEIDAAGGSDGNVNFVVMYDGKAAGPGTYRGLIGTGAAANTVSLTPPEGEVVNIGEQNMADPQQLAGFITWAKANYPADHYGIILSAHGDGWKLIGPDETSITRDKDYLYMGELQTALVGQHFDLIGFDACLMAGIEVAYQVRQATDYVISSEELIPGNGFPYDTFATALKANSAWSGLDLGKNIIAGYGTRYKADTGWTLSLIDTRPLVQLAGKIDTWAGLLRTGAGLFQKRNDPSDNVQTLLRFDRALSQQFDDPNFVDIYDLALHIDEDPSLPACVKTPIFEIKDLITKQVVVAQVHSPDLPGAHGIHIYFPKTRKQSVESWDDYDEPRTRHTDGNSPRAVYAQSNDQLPLKARDRETGAALNPRFEWPQPVSPSLQFATDTSWSRFLERYYHPVADNRILRGVGPDGKIYLPTSTGGGACANPSDSIDLPVGSNVFLSAVGSSDADQPDFPTAPGLPGIPNFYPSFAFWDLDSTKGCVSGCDKQPHTVPPGSPAHSAATNMDSDRDLTNTNFDQNDAVGITVSRGCATVGAFQVNLMVWDDNHLTNFHNTVPDASYVHPQTDSHLASINCTAAPPVTTRTDIPSTVILPLSFTVTLDPFASASFVALSSGTATATFSGLNSNLKSGSPLLSPRVIGQITLTGDRPQIVPATGNFDTATNSFDITGTSTGPVAGFLNVRSRYTLSLGPNFDTITGTYQVGLNSTLNNEPQPITYKVTGTITNKTYPAATGPVVSTVITVGANATISQNGWTEIHGTNLVPATTPAAGVIWSSAPEFAQGRMPTQLGGVSVTVNGKAAFIYFYCSAATSKVCKTDQLNVLTPLDTTIGPVSIAVTSAGVSSPAFTAAMTASTPSFLQFSGEGYVAATHSDYSLIGPSTLYPGFSTPAKPGESIALYGVGFGVATGVTLTNGSSSQNGPLLPTPTCTIGSLNAPVVFAGLISPGLYQINITVPTGATTSEIACSYKGLSTPPGDLITVQP